MKAGDKVYRGYRTAGRIEIHCATVKAAGEKAVVLADRLPAWRFKASVEPSDCYPDKVSAFTAVLKGLKADARDYRESADELDEQVRKAEADLEVLKASEVKP